MWPKFCEIIFSFCDSRFEKEGRVCKPRQALPQKIQIGKYIKVEKKMKQERSGNTDSPGAWAKSCGQFSSGVQLDLRQYSFVQLNGEPNLKKASIAQTQVDGESHG